METKILKAVFGGGTSTVTNKRTRTDYGQVLEIIGIDLPDTFECIFSNSATSAGVGKKQIGSAQRVLIPDEYLTTGQPIYAWILLHDTEDDGRHMYSIRIPVADMPDTSPEEPTPVEQSVISQAITALNTAVDTTTQKAQEAADSANRAEQAAEGVEGYAERAEAAQSASESARDIALEAKVSAQTSAATASEKASEAISSATTASQSALTAENASESAQEYATASAESASQASQSADTASGKASDASEYASNANTSAQTASQKASEAAQSASTAVQAKTDAQSAKTASETAQGLAETARNEAVNAKTGAETARDEAQDIVDGITGKVEQIDSNTERIESLEDDRYKPYAVDSASGSIASFADGADDIPLKSCIVQVDPVQDLHGYDSPWPGGGGTNQWDEQWELGSINFDTGELVDGTSTIRSKNYIPVAGGGTYQIVFPNPNNNTMRIIQYDANKEYIRYSTANAANGMNKTLNASTAYLKFYMGTSYGSTYGNDIAINYPSTNTSYSPYENICPITGWTGCEVQRTGKNLLPFPYKDGSSAVGGITWTSNEDGTVTVNGTSSSNRYYWLYSSATTPVPSWAKALAGKTVTVSAGNGSFVEQGYASMQMIFYGTSSLVIHERTATIPSDLSSYTGFGCVLFVNGGNTVNATVMPQIELGTTATPYEPYTGQTYPITFPTEAGTIYGGYVDVTGGELVVDTLNLVLDGTESGWQAYGDNVCFNASLLNKTLSVGTQIKGYCSHVATLSTGMLDGTYFQHSNSGKGLEFRGVTDKWGLADNTPATIKAFLASEYDKGTPVQIVAYLQSPLHYPLTANQINSLYGQNNIWADTGDMEVEYRADTTLYINKKIAETISALS